MELVGEGIEGCCWEWLGAGGESGASSAKGFQMSSEDCFVDDR